MSSHAPEAPTATPASAPVKNGWSFNIGLAISLASLAVIAFIAYTIADKKGWIEAGYSELPHPTDTRKREVREAVIKRGEIETKGIPERIINDGDDKAIDEFNAASDREEQRLKKLDSQHSNAAPASTPKVLNWTPPLDQKTEDLGNGTFRVTNNPTLLWPDAKIPIAGHSILQVMAGGKMCSPPSPCNGPEGLPNFGFARLDTTTNKPYIYGDAIYNELIGRFDNGTPFRVGREGELPIPDGAATVSFMPNIREAYLSEAGGGWVVVIKIH